MLESGPATQAQALDEAKALGADVIRANVIWSRYAPSPTSSRRPRGFDAKDPNAYPNLAIVDSLVAGAQARGMQVLLTPTGPIPAWASRCRGSRRHQARVQAQPAAVRPVRARARHALPDREAVVDLERAEPALVAAAAVRGVGLGGRPEVRVAVSRARRVGDRRPAWHRPPRRPDLARRDRAARRRSLRVLEPAPPARARPLRRPDPQDLAGDLPARRVLPERRRRAPGRHGGARSALLELQAAESDRLRPSPVHPRRFAPAAVAHQHGRDHDRRRHAALAPARPRGARQADPGGAADPLHRARLADEPAGPDLRRDGHPAGRVHEPVRLDRLQQCSGAHRRPVQDRR